MFLDLNFRHFTRSRGLLLIIGTWYRDEAMQWQPALAIVRSDDEIKRIAVPCIVPAANAWVWSEEIGDPARAAQSAFEFAKALRIDDDALNVLRLAGLIHDHIPDLLSIPPLPASERGERGVAEGVIRDLETGKSTEIEIRA